MLNITDPMGGIQKAKFLLKQGKTAEARAVLRYLARQYPESAEVWLLNERACETLEQKMFCLVQALQIDPESAEAHTRMSQLQESPPVEHPRLKPFQPSSHLPPPPLPAREVLEPLSTPLERPVRQSRNAPAGSIPRKSSPASSPRSAQHQTMLPAKQKPRFRWWFIMFPVLSILLSILVSVFQNQSPHIAREKWIMEQYGYIAQYGDWQYEEQNDAYNDSAVYRNSQTMEQIGLVLMFFFFAIWFINGVVGGFMLAIKKLRGSDWAWLLVLLPVVLFPAYLVLSGFLGEVMYAIGKYSGYSKKKCPQCQGWIPISATRCQHCGQAVQ